MTTFTMTVTDAGRAAIVNGEHTGLNPLRLTHIGLGNSNYTPAPSQTALVSETKRLTTFGGRHIGNDVIHISIQDSSSDTYSLREFGIYTDTGVLFGVFALASGAILEKNAQSSLLLSVNLHFISIDSHIVDLPTPQFFNPPATTETSGTTRYATDTQAEDMAANDVALVPRNLDALNASPSKKGLVKLASDEDLNIDSAEPGKLPDINQVRMLINKEIPVLYVNSISELRLKSSVQYEIAVLSEAGLIKIYEKTSSSHDELLPIVIVSNDGKRWVESSYGQTLKSYKNLVGNVNGSGLNGQEIPLDKAVTFSEYLGISDLKLARLESEAITPPSSDFNFVPFGIWAEHGGAIKTDFDISVYRNRKTRTYVYINPWGGSDSNDGLSWQTAKASLQNALNGTAETIFLAPGIYHRRSGVFYWRENNVRRNLNVICPEGRALITRRWEQEVDGGTVTWSDEGQGLFKASRSSTAAVYATEFSESGDYLKLPSFNNLTALRAANYGWSAQPGGELFIKLPDASQPSFDNCAIFINDNYPCAKFSGENTTLYLENIDFEGGTNVLEAIATDETDSFKIFAKNCTFKYAYSGEGISIYGASLAAFQNCSANGNHTDGFSYHASNVNGFTGGRMIEVNCVGRGNGTSGSGNDNGSTLHDGWIGVRVNGCYYKNFGPNVPDVLGSKSWNVGVSSIGSLGVGSVHGFQSGNSDVYLDRCSHIGGGVGLLTNSGGRLYLRKTIINGGVQLGGGSSLQEY